ncbi:peptide/nickel transport system permease protein [Rhodoligotrophos appendicifer]|uniref:ABC transporter permease n=1 Tax=Rhodoligotrophos appendicifer TaxID=987056 RepID=UPI00117FC276|nr:ABC transporter permease [Rhodoligotrophos appendicifer]
MTKFILQRLASTIPVLILTSLIIFLLMRLLPGDPIIMMVGDHTEVSEETLEQLRIQNGLDRSLPIQYLYWVQNAVQGDLGRSINGRQPVWDVLAPRILPTAQIGLTAWILAMLVAIPLGALSASRMNSWADWCGTVLALIGAAMPYFLLGGLLIYVVALRAGLLPVSGYVSPFVDVGQSIRSTVLPAITLSLALAAVITRQARSSFADTLQHPFIRTARAKGLSETNVIIRHALRNAMLPIITILGLQLGTLFSGAVVTEMVFAIPGIGRLLVDSILSRDYPVVQAVVLFITMSVVLATLLVDIAYGLLDPRMRPK